MVNVIIICCALLTPKIKLCCIPRGRLAIDDRLQYRVILGWHEVEGRRGGGKQMQKAKGKRPSADSGIPTNVFETWSRIVGLVCVSIRVVEMKATTTLTQDAHTSDSWPSL